jgi:hypothetical protein
VLRHAAGLVALPPLLAICHGRIMTASMCEPLLDAGLVAATANRSRPAGLLLAASYVVRPEGLLIGAVTALARWRSPRAALEIALGMAVIAVPYVA